MWKKYVAQKKNCPTPFIAKFSFPFFFYIYFSFFAPIYKVYDHLVFMILVIICQRPQLPHFLKRFSLWCVDLPPVTTSKGQF